MGKYTKNDIVRLVEEEDVEFIRLQFIDIFGTLKNMAVTTSQLDKVLNNMCMFDSAAIEGFNGDENHISELILAPDLDTFAIFPWRPQRGKVARFICDVLNPDGTPFEGDSRYILKKTIKQAHDMGYKFNVGPECEFFLFDMGENGEPTTHTNEKGGFFDIGPVDLGENARRDMVLSLSEMGFEIESSYHANEASQHEIDFKYDTALHTADNIMTFKLAVRTVAKRHGLHATFMPKPKRGVKGSGMRFNMSLAKDGQNIFSDDNDKNGMSQEGYYFMAGIMKHIKGMTLINNSIVNSYKRLIPGYQAPVNIGWSTTNRSQLIRITDVGKFGSRIILRSPDAACNPYLVLAACLSAGLDGIRNQMLPPKSIEERKNMNKKIDVLPRSLKEAIVEFEKDAYLQEVLGKYISSNYTMLKRVEWNEYCEQITPWEVDRYLDRI